MVLLLGALALASSIVHPAGRPGQVQPLYQSPPHHTISAFAENHGVLAWFEPNPKQCNVVWVLQGVVRDSLPAQGGSHRNVTCRWQVPAGSAVNLALATGASTVSALWSLRESATRSPVRFDYVLGAALSDPNERRFQEVAHGNRGAGFWPRGLAGDDVTLVFAVSDVAVAVALSADVLALLEQTPTGMTIAWYDPAGVDALGEIPVPATTTALAAGKGVLAFRVGRSIRVVEASAKRARLLTKAAKTPIGLSVDGLRVAWAENVAGRGRIRAVSVG